MKIALIAYAEVTPRAGTMLPEASEACNDLEVTIEGVLPEIAMNENDQPIGTVKWGGVTVREVIE